MVHNPITEEIRDIRHVLATEFDNDVYRIGAELRRRQAASGRHVIRLTRRAPNTNTTDKALHPSGSRPVGASGHSIPAAG